MQSCGKIISCGIQNMRRSHDSERKNRLQSGFNQRNNIGGSQETLAEAKKRLLKVEFLKHRKSW